MQFGKNVVEQFLWESYNIDSRKYLFKLLEDADEENRIEILKNRFLENLFLIRRGKDAGFAFHIYEMVQKDGTACRNTALYIQKLLFDGSYYDENQLFSPCPSNIRRGNPKLIVDTDLKHTYEIPFSFEDRGDGCVNIRQIDFFEQYDKMYKMRVNESLEYFKQRYDIAIENKDDLTADAIRDLIREYETGQFTSDYSGKRKFYWNADTLKKEKYELTRYLSENIQNCTLYNTEYARSELQLAIEILSLGLEEKLIAILDRYDIDLFVKSPEKSSSLAHNKFLMDAFSITSIIWFNSLSLKEKERLMNRVYTFDQEKMIDYLTHLKNGGNSAFSLNLLALSMYLNGSLDIAESIYSYLKDNTKDNFDKAGYLSRLGDICRDKTEYTKACEMYRQLLDLSSNLSVKHRQNNTKSLNFLESPRYISIIALLRIAEMEFFIGEIDAEKHLEEVKERIERTKKLEKISLMWNLAYSYRRTGQFDKEYDCLDDLASIGKGKREDLVNKADERLSQINEHFSWDLEKLDEKKLKEKEQFEKLSKLLFIAEALKNSFQFERESHYLNIALKIKNDDRIKFDFAISKYSLNKLTEARACFENLIHSSEIGIVSKSYIYLALIDFQQSDDQRGLDNVQSAFLPYIEDLSAIKQYEHECLSLKQDFSQKELDIIMKLNDEVLLDLQSTIKLCITNLIRLNKDKLLKQILDYLLESTAQKCSEYVHFVIIYTSSVIIFNNGLTEETLDLSKKSLDQLSSNSKYKIALMDHTAQIYFYIGQYNQSVRYLKDVLEIDSQLPGIWKNLGLNYEQLLDFKNAEECIDRAIDLKPDDRDLDKLKDKYNTLKKNTINFNDIEDEEVKRFFMSAERLLLDLPKSVKENEFDFTMALVSYGKGLESLMHKEVSLPLRKKIQRKYGTPISDKNFNNLPYTLKNILGKDERTIPLGSWQYILDDCKKDNNNPIIKEARDYFAGKLNKNKMVIFESCRNVSDYRNGSAHYTSKTMDEIMEDRKNIIEQINNVIGALNSKQVKSL